MTDREEWRLLWWSTGGVALICLGAWALPTAATWAAAAFGAFADRFRGATGAAVLLLGGVVLAAGFLAACAWRETTITEVP
jgi:hypothetical protein